MGILYQNTQDFHDITSGTSTGTPHYSAGPGYDYVTGLGTPMANLVVGTLVGTSAAPHDTLVLTASSAQMAGTSFSLTVTADNSSGVTDTGYDGTIQFSSTDVQAGLPSDFTFTPGDDGTFTFTVTLKTAGSQSITAADTGNSAITGTLSGITVSPAAASRLVVSGFPSTATAGVSESLTVTALDPYGNVAAGYTGTVALNSTDPHAILSSSETFAVTDDGTLNFTVTLDTAGTQSITATDTTTASITGTESKIVVHAAAAKTLALTGFPTTDTAGTVGTMTVTAYDAYGNVATGYTGTVALTSTDPHAVLPSSYTFTAGVAGQHSFGVTLDTAGTESITVTDKTTSSLTATESNINVKPGAAATLKLTGFPTSDTAGTTSTVTVTAYDAYGNVATGYTGTVALMSTDPHAVLSSSYTFTGTDAGTHAFTVTLDTAGKQSITATDTTTSSITGAESGITVATAAAESLTITGFPVTDTAGAVENVTVIAYDAYGNVATGYTGAVGFSSTDPHAALPSSYTFTASDVGQHTFGTALDTAGTQSITVTDTATPSLSATESNITVKPAAAATLAVTGFPEEQHGGHRGYGDGRGLRRLWQRGNRLHRHRGSDEHATPTPCCDRTPPLPTPTRAR